MILIGEVEMVCHGVDCGDGFWSFPDSQSAGEIRNGLGWPPSYSNSNRRQKKSFIQPINSLAKKIIEAENLVVDLSNFLQSLLSNFHICCNPSRNQALRPHQGNLHNMDTRYSSLNPVDAVLGAYWEKQEACSR